MKRKNTRNRSTSIRVKESSVKLKEDPPLVSMSPPRASIQQQLSSIINYVSESSSLSLSPKRDIQPSSTKNNASIPTSEMQSKVATLQQPQNQLTSSLTPLIVPQSRRWRDWWLRWFTGWFMITGMFAYAYTFKQPGMALFIAIIQTLMYKEIVSIALSVSHENELPTFHYFYYYWFLVAMYLMYSKTLQVYFISAITSLVAKSHISKSISSISSGATPFNDADDAEYLFASGFQILHNTSASIFSNFKSTSINLLHYSITHCVPIAFVLWILGLCAFVISLRQRKHLRYQFAQFAYCHMALIVVVVQSTFLVANIYAGGLIWFFVPCGLVVQNDVFAYFFGFFFGKTPLIRLSPKKTWEGFLGGSIATFLGAFWYTGFLQSITFLDIKYLMVCPVEYGVGTSIHYCNTSTIANGLYVSHKLIEYKTLAYYLSYILPEYYLHTLTLSKMQLHAAALALFASFIAPFGGFFASGFKRTLRIKDFSSAIPGHGGFTDRMDCQVVMGAFSYIYARYILGIGVGYSGGESDVATILVRLVKSMSTRDLNSLYEMIGLYLASAGQLERVQG
jgi:phosphatidate cytidylyltransferase